MKIGDAPEKDFVPEKRRTREQSKRNDILQYQKREKDDDNKKEWVDLFNAKKSCSFTNCSADIDWKELKETLILRVHIRTRASWNA